MTVGKGLTREERETTISFDENGQTVRIETLSPVFLRKLQRLAEFWGVTVEIGSYDSVQVELPIKALSFRKPIKLSTNERERRTAILRKARTP